MVSDNVANSSVVIAFRHFSDFYVPKRTVSNTLNKYATIYATKMYGMMILTICLFLFCICRQGIIQHSGDFIYKWKAKFIQEQATKAQRGSIGTALRHAPSALPPGKYPVPIV